MLIPFCIRKIFINIHIGIMAMVLVTRQAPDFTSSAVLGNGEIVDNFNFKKHIEGKAAVLFFYPLDFTFVCPSE